MIRGHAPPGARIEAINLSAIPAVRRRAEETMIIAIAGEDGRFEGRLEMVDRDLVRIRARTRRGRLSRWVAFRARVPGTTRRKLVVALWRIALRDTGRGCVLAFSVNPSRPISEPRARLLFVNARTGATASAILDRRANLPLHFAIPGSEGDRIEIRDATSDDALGSLVVPPKNANGVHVRPGRYHQAIRFRPLVKRFQGKLFRGRPRPEDVLQSELPDCYLASAVTAIARTHHRTLRATVKPLGCGRYEVALKTFVPALGVYRTDSIEVTSDLYVRPCGLLLYGSGAITHDVDQTPLWWPILEKAYAIWRGGYDVLGIGGTPHRVFEAILGMRPRHFFVEERLGEEIWTEIVRGVRERRPLAVITAGKESTLRYRNTGIYPNHSYAIMGCREDRTGRFVELRNPWGECTPREDGREHHGCFEIPYADFLKLFTAVSTVSRTEIARRGRRANRRESDGDNQRARRGASPPVPPRRSDTSAPRGRATRRRR
jgi:calpain family cysteine protease